MSANDALPTFRIEPLSERSLDEVIEKSGGKRAHLDADRRAKPGADYLLGGVLIELKLLNEEGLEKPNRQRKLAELFREYGDTRPVVVVDRDRLPADGQRKFDRILDPPVKTAVAKARDQLLQSREEIDSANVSILMIINNGYTALDQDALVKLVVHRVRQDTRSIDGVIVGGCYYYSDGYEHAFFWPIEYVQINLDSPFNEFAHLKRAWDAYAEQAMTSLVLGKMPVGPGKGAIVDTEFEVDGVTYVKPAPPMGAASEFYIGGRPRKRRVDHSPIAITYPSMTAQEWRLFRDALPRETELKETFQQWVQECGRAARAGSALKPAVAIDVTMSGWRDWCETGAIEKTMWSLRQYANHLFGVQITDLKSRAKERLVTAVLPARYIFLVSEEIGQDQTNDLAKIALTKAGVEDDVIDKVLVPDNRISFDRALSLACAYAIVEGLDQVLWQNNQRYAWR